MNITEAFKNALLADATYAIKGSIATKPSELLSVLSGDLGDSLAHYVVDNFDLDFDSIINTSNLQSKKSSDLDVAVGFQNKVSLKLCFTHHVTKVFALSPPNRRQITMKRCLSGSFQG